MRLLFSIVILFSLTVIVSGLGLAAVHAQSTPETTEPPFYPSECDDMPRETLEEKIEKRECRVAEAQRGVDYAPPSRVSLWVDELEKRQAGLDRLLEKQAAAAESTEPEPTTPVPEATPEPTPTPEPVTPTPEPVIPEPPMGFNEIITEQLEILAVHIETLEALTNQIKVLETQIQTTESEIVLFNQELHMHQFPYLRSTFDVQSDLTSMGITSLNGKLWVVDSCRNGVGVDGCDNYVRVYNVDGTRDSSSDFDLFESNYASGVTAHDGKLYVVVGAGVHVYNADGTRDSSSDFDFIGHGAADGITSLDGKLWVVHEDKWYDSRAYSYNTDGTMDSSFGLHNARTPNYADSNFYPYGITSLDGKLWVLDGRGDLFVYHTSGARDTTFEFDFPELTNFSLRGITSLDGDLWVLATNGGGYGSIVTQSVYAYNVEGLIWYNVYYDIEQ